MMRHNFVTICKRACDPPDATMRFLIGYLPASKVMKTTYAHLSDDDHPERAEVAAGVRDPTVDGRTRPSKSSLPKPPILVNTPATRFHATARRRASRRLGYDNAHPNLDGHLPVLPRHRSRQHPQIENTTHPEPAGPRERSEVGDRPWVVG